MNKLNENSLPLAKVIDNVLKVNKFTSSDQHPNEYDYDLDFETGVVFAVSDDIAEDIANVLRDAGYDVEVDENQVLTNNVPSTNFSSNESFNMITSVNEFKAKVNETNHDDISSYYELSLLENKPDGKKLNKVIVTQSTYKKLKKLQHFGGFKRFEIDLYDDDSSDFKLTSIKKINRFLEDIKAPTLNESMKNEAFVFDFEDFDDTYLNGPSQEMAIHELINNAIFDINTTIDSMIAGTGANVIDAKRQAAREITRLWKDAIDQYLANPKFEGNDMTFHGHI